MNKTERIVDIGVVSECEAWKLHARFFPSKVGGRPAWLSRRPPQPASLQCGMCKEPLVFLCQIYAPIESTEEAFHRTLFIFICRNGKCYKPNDSSSIKVLRCQLPRNNEFYPYEPPNEEKDEPFDDSKCPSLCYVCGCKGPSHCSKCKKVNYCSRIHQIYDWRNGHKDKCGTEKNDDTSLPMKNGILFPEWELITDEENEKDESKEKSVEEEMELLQNLIKEKKAGSLNDASETELELYTNKSVEDKVFGKFKTRVSRDPDQVLRYDLGGDPLWIATAPTITNDYVPNCQYCNGKRQYECQIMPQLLNHLDLDLGVHSIDWGVLIIYTCAASCSESDMPYKNEYVFKQDLASNSSNAE